MSRHQTYVPGALGDPGVLGRVYGAVTDHEYLLATFEQMRRRNGQAPGPDGYSYADLSRSEAAGIMRSVARCIQSGDYRPGPSRAVRIPKPAGGTRTLRLRSIVDRVVSGALHRLLTPLLDALYLPGSYAYRPGRCVHRMLADMEHVVTTLDCWVVSQDDIRDAYGSIVIGEVIDDLRRHANHADLLRLIEAVLRGHEGPSRTVGIDQGDPLSPLMLNLRLHHAHDEPLHAAHGGTSHWYRYADNLVYLTRSVSEGMAALDLSRCSLRHAGMRLKGADGSPVNLRRQGARADVLGFRMCCGDGRDVRYGVAPQAWTSLGEALCEVWLQPHPARAAERVSRGWIEAYGPAHEAQSHDTTARRILQVAAREGLRERLQVADLIEQMEQAHRRWLQVRGEVSACAPRKCPLCFIRFASQRVLE